MDCGAFACGLALDLLVCGIGAAFCGVCAVRDEVLSFAWGVSGFFEEVVGGVEGGIDIDRDYCWAAAGVGRIWICAGGQVVSALFGG